MLGGRIYLIPAISNELYFLRFAICAERITIDDIRYSFSVIKTSVDVVMCKHFTAHDRKHKPTIDIDISPRRIHSTSSDVEEIESGMKNNHLNIGLTNGKDVKIDL